MITVRAGTDDEMQHVAIRDCRENIKYILWEADLHRLNFDEATGTTVGDPTRNRLVVRKTRGQL